jgi:ribosomal protein L37AE/L43A
MEVREMEQQGEDGAEGPTHGCMQCKACQYYMVDELRNRNTLWRCAVCGYVVNVIPGQYTAAIVESGSEA